MPVDATAIEANALKWRVDRLESAVKELERIRVEGIAREMQLELRLGAIEAARQGQAATVIRVGTETTARAVGPLSVAVPFVVRDQNDKTIFSIDRSPETGHIRAILGDPGRSSVALVATGEGGILALSDATEKVRVVASAATASIGLSVKLDSGSTFMGKSPDGQPVVQVINPSQYPVAELKGMLSNTGQLVIANASGTNMVVAGVTTKGVGIVKTGPGGLGPAAAMGNVGQPASEITGKIR
jgi:hypothetical protein